MHRAHGPWIGSGPSFVVAFALLAPGFAGADTYHVAPTGNDADPGGVDYPWATLQHAADWVRPGDEVLVADGEYTGFRLTTAGTAAAPIAFRAEADAAVINAPPVPDGPGITLQDTAWVTIEGFRIAGVPAAGIHASSATGSLQGIVVRGNEVVDVGGEAAAACIVLVHAADVTIEANVLHGCAGAGIDLPSAEDTRVQNNIVYGTGEGGIISSGGDRIPGPDNLVVANNTVHVPEAGGWALRIAALGGVGTGNAVFNNILLSEDAAGGSIVLEGDVGFASARNVGVDRFSTDDGATTLTLAQFQASGYELGSITSTATALFVDGSMGDYRIRAGCPAVNWGVPELNGNAAPAFDIRGTPRPIGPSYDLGAYEYCAGWTCGGADGDADADADGGADADAPSDARPDGSTGNGDGGGCGCTVGGSPAERAWSMLAIVGGVLGLLLLRARARGPEHGQASLAHGTRKSLRDGNPELPGQCARRLKPAGRLPGLFPSLLILCALCVSAVSPARAATYEVGPGMPLAGIGEVPWESLAPGDLVLIHWRTEPYREKFVIAAQGTEAQPVIVRGVPNDAGELPIIDGQSATTRDALDFTNEDRGVIKIGSSNTPDCYAPDCVPSWITIENLDVRSARPPYSFTSSRGGGSYADNAAAIYIEVGRNIILRSCIIRDSGNGLFIGAYDGETQDILVEGNWVYDNGIEGSIYEHNSYTAARGITFQYNHYGPLRAGCGGNNLKDRSAGLVVRYNWIENGNRQLDLVDGEDTSVIVDDPRYRQTFVYGNILVEADGEGNNQILHYGGDSGDESIYRKGTLYFHNNTVVSTRTGNTTLFRLSTNDEHCDARNNVFYVGSDGAYLALLAENGVLDLTHNWLKPGWVDSHDVLAGTINDDGTSVTGAAPGFVNEGAQDFHLADGSPCVNAGTDLIAAVLPANDVVLQYVTHQRSEPRPLEPPFDLGAYERCVSGSCGGADADADADADGDADADADADADTGSESGPDVTGDTRTDGGDGGPPSGDGGGGCGCRAAESAARGAWWIIVMIGGVIGVLLRRR